MTKVNPYVTDEEAAKLLSLLESVLSAFQKYSQPLTTQQRRALLKMKPGGEEVVTLVAKVAEKQGVLAKAVSVEDMQSSLAAAVRLREPVALANAVAQAINDAMLRYESTSWTGTTFYYSTLKQLAKKDPALDESLTTAKQLFGRRSQAAQDRAAAAKAERNAVKLIKKAAKETARAQAVKARNGGSDSAATPDATGGADTNGTTPAGSTTPATSK